MHASSFEKMRAVRHAYVGDRPKPGLRVLDVGSGCGPGAVNYRELFGPPDFEYVGLDIEAGYNVDLVPKDPYSWAEIDDETFQIVISGQAFEHIPYFWITGAEMARVLVGGGLLAIVAPSAGYAHRYPLDCWRFYPDSWGALCAYLGLEIVETFRERSSWRRVIPGTYWRDTLLVARKPNLVDPAERSRFYQRLAAIVDTRADAPAPVTAAQREGRAKRSYLQAHTLPLRMVAYRPFRVLKAAQERITAVRESRVARAVRRRIAAMDEKASRDRGAKMLPWKSPGHSD